MPPTQPVLRSAVVKVSEAEATARSAGQRCPPSAVLPWNDVMQRERRQQNQADERKTSNFWALSSDLDQYFITPLVVLALTLSTEASAVFDLHERMESPKTHPDGGLGNPGALKKWACATIGSAIGASASMWEGGTSPVTLLTLSKKNEQSCGF